MTNTKSTEWEAKATDWNKKTPVEISAAYDAVLDVRDEMLVNNCIGKEWEIVGIVLDRIREAYTKKVLDKK
jgi:mRNA-degrading endonuclease HigB of HigAB toxin-antitoxin module